MGIPRELQNSLRLVWADNGIQMVISKANELPEYQDTFEFFIQDLERCCDKDLKPNDDGELND